ncbi:MAG: aldehyde ferredoxin oxidoreductase N-terminal domain-containing protein, partial [Atribacterota bacterium]|nr:aldehyde ferredoxin oxidoreductase N-terminal domain-containing protein [Atribacterota bacterium]
MFGGYLRKILFVDLTKKTIAEEELSNSLITNYLGGYGIGAKIIYDHQKKGLKPFDEGNLLGILTGPLTGTGLPFVSRFTVVG